MSATYTTIADLTGQEIVPALDGVGADFDVDALVARLRTDGAIYYDEYKQGFVIVRDEDGNTPGFWEAVADLDAA